MLPTRSSCRANSPWLAGVLCLVSYRCIPVDSAKGQRRGGGSCGQCKASGAAVDRTVGGAGVDHVVVAVATTVTVLGFAVCRAAILRCTVHFVCYQTPGAVSPAARACTVQWSTGCCRWTARVASTACRIRRRTPGRRRYARWQRSTRLRGRYQASFSGQAYVRTCGLVHMFFEASVYTCFSGASPPFRREAPLCRDRVAVGRLRLPARSAQSGASPPFRREAPM